PEGGLIASTSQPVSTAIMTTSLWPSPTCCCTEAGNQPAISIAAVWCVGEAYRSAAKTEPTIKRNAARKSTLKHANSVVTASNCKTPREIHNQIGPYIIVMLR